MRFNQAVKNVEKEAFDDFHSFHACSHLANQCRKKAWLTACHFQKVAKEGQIIFTGRKCRTLSKTHTWETYLNPTYINTFSFLRSP